MADKSLTPIDLPELSVAPASPASGFHRFYAKTDGKAYSKSSAGTEYDLTTGVSLTTTGTSGAATLVGSTLNIPQYQSVLTNPVTGTGTSGQVSYWSGTTTQTGSNNLFWDAANGRLGIGTASAQRRLTVEIDSGYLLAMFRNRGITSNDPAEFVFQHSFNGTDNASNMLALGTAPAGRQAFIYINGSDRIRLHSDGKIGFVDLSPLSVASLGSKVSIAGNVSIGSTYCSSSAPTNGIIVEGSVAIGTTTSSGRVTIRGSGTTSATTALLVQNSTPTANFTIRDDGGYAFRNGTVGLAQTGYTTFTNLTTDRTCDANATTVEELADILGTLIEDLKTKGIIAA